MGSVYKRGAIWWVKYYRHGKAHYESSRSAHRADARALLRSREGDIQRGRPVFPKAWRITVDDLLEGLLRDYEANERASIRTLRSHIARLSPAFGPWKATDLGPDDPPRYARARQDEGAANGTINRELSTLQRAYTLGIRDGKVASRPHISRLPENNVRQGFFEPAQFESICRHLPPYAVPAVRFMYLTGWRKGLVLQLRWADVTDEGIRPPQAVGRKVRARLFPWTHELRVLLGAQRDATDTAARENGVDVPWVFHRQGKCIADFRKAWETACKKAGCPGMYRHDFRRTAARNLLRLGLSERVVMELVGWKTRAMLDRYNIVSDTDVLAAAARIDAARGTTARPPSPTLQLPAARGTRGRPGRALCDCHVPALT